MEPPPHPHLPHVCLPSHPQPCPDILPPHLIVKVRHSSGHWSPRRTFLTTATHTHSHICAHTPPAIQTTLQSLPCNLSALTLPFSKPKDTHKAPGINDRTLGNGEHTCLNLAVVGRQCADDATCPVFMLHAPEPARPQLLNRFLSKSMRGRFLNKITWTGSRRPVLTTLCY